MPLTIQKYQLCRGVSAVIAGYAKRFTVAWYELMLLDFDGETLTLATGNGGGRCWFRIKVEDAACAPFRISVKASELQKICSEVRSDTLTLSEDGSKLQIVSDRSRLSLAIFGEWPSLPEITGEPVVRIAAGELIYALRAALPTVDENSDRYALGSIQIKAGKESHVYSTDGRRLSDIAIQAEYKGEPGLLVPHEMIGMVAGIVGKSDDSSIVSIYDCDSSVAFVTDSGVAYVTQTAGRFPNVSTVISNSFNESDKAADFIVNVEDVKSAIREAIIGYDANADWSSCVCLAFDGSRLTVLSDAHSTNDMVVNIEVSDASGRACMVIDHKFFTQALSACGTDDARVQIVSAPKRACALVSSGAYRSLIMGMALTQEVGNKIVPSANALRCAQALEAVQPLVV